MVDGGSSFAGSRSRKPPYRPELSKAARRGYPPDPVDLYLQPYPDRLLEEASSVEHDPEHEAILAEGIGLAVVATMQLLPPKQRAVLILRDVLGWRSREVAALLGDTVPAVNSALQRARTTIAREQDAQTLARRHTPSSRVAEERVVRKFREAWARVDVPGIVALITDDALLTMPPVAMELIGLEEIGDFFATKPAGGHLDRIELIDARANGQPAIVSYADEDRSGTGRAYGVMVLAIRGSRYLRLHRIPERPRAVPTVRPATEPLPHAAVTQLVPEEIRHVRRFEDHWLHDLVRRGPRLARSFYRDVFGKPLVFEDPRCAIFDFGSTLINLLAAPAAVSLIAPAPVGGPDTAARFHPPCG